MKPAPETVKDRDTWALLQELDEHGEDLTQWEIDFVEDLTKKLLLGIKPSDGTKRKLDEIREDRLPWPYGVLLTLTDAQIRGLLAMEARATRDPWHEESLSYGIRHLRKNVDWYGEDCPDDMGLPFTPADASLIVASRAHLRALCEEVLRLRARESAVRTIDLTNLPKREPRFTFTDGPFNDDDGDQS